VGGVLSAGPDRLEAAGALGIPQVVSLGALDMVNFGPYDTVPPQFKGRLLYKHNPTITLMRTTPEECAELGRRIARKLNAARGPVALFIPLKGVSLIAREGQVFYDPAAGCADRKHAPLQGAAGGSVRQIAAESRLTPTACRHRRSRGFRGLASGESGPWHNDERHDAVRVRTGPATGGHDMPRSHTSGHVPLTHIQALYFELIRTIQYNTLRASSAAASPTT
jgi:hypothetical protein